MAKKKYKQMTKREKEEMKQIRKELREKGAIPPVKKRLNRKDYIENTRNKWNEPEEGNSWIYLTRAVSWVMDGLTIRVMSIRKRSGRLRCCK